MPPPLTCPFYASPFLTWSFLCPAPLPGPFYGLAYLSFLCLPVPNLALFIPWLTCPFYAPHPLPVLFMSPIPYLVLFILPLTCPFHAPLPSLSFLCPLPYLSFLAPPPLPVLFRLPLTWSFFCNPTPHHLPVLFMHPPPPHLVLVCVCVCVCVRVYVLLRGAKGGAILGEAQVTFQYCYVFQSKADFISELIVVQGLWSPW